MEPNSKIGENDSNKKQEVGGADGGDNEVINCINNVITTDEKIIGLLGALTARAEIHGKRSKWAKVGGTSATTAGIGGQVVGLVLAPFTGKICSSLL